MYMCAGGSEQATWAVFNCSRHLKQTEATGGQEWQDDNDERGPYFVTYACQEGESLSPERNFAKDLSSYIRQNFIKNQGKLELNSTLLELPQSVGVYMAMNAKMSLTIQSSRQFIPAGPYADLATVANL